MTGRGRRRCRERGAGKVVVARTAGARTAGAHNTSARDAGARDTSARDTGAATLLAVSIVAVVLTLATGALMVGSVVVASHRARLAADLGALAGATVAQDRPDTSSACAAASRVAMANGAVTQTCSVDGADVELTVAVGSALWPAPRRRALGRGRLTPDDARVAEGLRAGCLARRAG